MTALIRVALAAALVRPAAGLAQVVPRAKIVPTDLGSFPPSRNFPAPGSTNSRSSATNTPDAALSDLGESTATVGVPTGGQQESPKFGQTRPPGHHISTTRSRTIAAVPSGQTPHKLT